MSIYITEPTSGYLGLHTDDTIPDDTIDSVDVGRYVAHNLAERLTAACEMAAISYGLPADYVRGRTLGIVASSLIPGAVPSIAADDLAEALAADLCDQPWPTRCLVEAPVADGLVRVWLVADGGRIAVVADTLGLGRDNHNRAPLAHLYRHGIGPDRAHMGRVITTLTRAIAASPPRTLSASTPSTLMGRIIAGQLHGWSADDGDTPERMFRIPAPSVEGWVA